MVYPDPWFLHALKVIEPSLTLRWLDKKQTWFLVQRKNGESWICPVAIPEDQHQRFLDGVRRANVCNEQQWWAEYEKAEKADEDRVEAMNRKEAADYADRFRELGEGVIPASHRRRERNIHGNRGEEFTSELR